MNEKAYLGDGVYAEWDEDRATLTLMTDDGSGPENVIALEPEVLFKLWEFALSVAAQRHDWTLDE